MLSGFWSRRATCKRSSGQSLRACDEIVIAERAARRFRVSNGGEARVARFPRQPCKIGNARKHRLYVHQRVVFSRRMRPYARPWPILCMFDQAGADRIEADIPHRRDEMTFIHDDGCEPALEEMSRPTTSRIDKMRVAPVRRAHGPCNAESSVRVRTRCTWLGIRQ